MTESLLLNMALVGALIPLLTAIGEMLKRFPAFQVAPEWLPIVNCGLGVAFAELYTFASHPPTSLEVAIAGFSGLAAGLASAHLYDAVRSTMGTSMKSQARRQRRRRAA